MKKIYSFILVVILGLSGRAQNEKFVDLSEDMKASLNIPVKPVDLSGIKSQKRDIPSIQNISGCDTLGTRWAGGNSHNGNMFDLVNTSTVSVQIISFDQCFATLQADSFEIYYKTGTFVGSETNSSAWTFLGRCYVAPTVSLTPIPIPISISVSIPPSATYGFYLTNVTAGSSNAYTNGTTLGNVLKTKDGLQFLEGKGGGYPFSVTFSPRIWNGVIHYCTPLIAGVTSLTTGSAASDVYPNPMNNAASVTINHDVKLHNAVLKVYDMAGRVVYVMNGINENDFTFNHNLNSGLYVVKVENENSVVLNKKISVE